MESTQGFTIFSSLNSRVNDEKKKKKQKRKMRRRKAEIANLLTILYIYIERLLKQGGLVRHSTSTILLGCGWIKSRG